MKKHYFLFILLATIALIAFKNNIDRDGYFFNYSTNLNSFNSQQQELLKCIEGSNVNSVEDRNRIIKQISLTRRKLKVMDFWFRYLEPIAQKKINGPLPVEWETEVFEKFEKPYKREGAGLTLAEVYLDEEVVFKDTLLSLIRSSISASKTFSADSITDELKTHHHFYLCNRLFLLNLASIYTTGFECPNPEQVVPELSFMLKEIQTNYNSFNKSFPDTKLSLEYLSLYDEAITFVDAQPQDYSKFDHFTFIEKYINSLYAQNQKMILQYKIVSKSLVDYSLNKNCETIFNKTLYNGQNPKGIFLRVKDEAVLSEIDKVGKLLFYDPIVSGNNERSCVSCHNPQAYFADTIKQTSFQYNHKDFLPRNSPSLLNVQYNHLIMADGKHISLQDQTKAVINNPIEMGSSEKDVLGKVLSCPDYKKAFEKLLKHTPQEKEITIDHIVSAITFYYSKFSSSYSPFDHAMNGTGDVDASVKNGFNIFMSKAQCATCHFVPQFNGVKPPFVSSEFEVLGVPKDTSFIELSSDKGRFEINPATETLNAFRTGSIRNSEFTKPYMHNGAFQSLSQVIDFYDAGGGQGRGLKVDNQTLSSDSLHLTKDEKLDLIKFISSLNEKIEFEEAPKELPISKNKMLNTRKVGGVY